MPVDPHGDCFIPRVEVPPNAAAGVLPKVEVPNAGAAGFANALVEFCACAVLPPNAVVGLLTPAASVPFTALSSG